MVKVQAFKSLNGTVYLNKNDCMKDDLDFRLHDLKQRMTQIRFSDNDRLSILSPEFVDDIEDFIEQIKDFNNRLSPDDKCLCLHGSF